MNFMNFKIVIVFLAVISVSAQGTFHILGDIRVHENGQLGFHTDLINDGNFDNNLGEVGFYNTNRMLSISGINQPVFYDMITSVTQDLNINVSVGVTNSKAFIEGRLITPRDTPEVFLDLIRDTPYFGESDNAFVDGYISNDGVLDFTFPVGDDFRVRPISINMLASENDVLGAYFYENPNTPTTFDTVFDTSEFEQTLSVVSNFEFWVLKGNIATEVTLTWDRFSNISILTDSIENLRVVGWSKVVKRWINLGNIAVSGNIEKGQITSKFLNPDAYSVLTLGSTLKPGEDILVYEAVSPNGDGKNDTLIIEGLDNYPDFELTIYNRWGGKIYEQKGGSYINWDGRSSNEYNFDKDELVPAGTYFYTLVLDQNRSLAGYFYFNY